MTNKEIIHRILDKMDLEIVKGSDDMLSPILPWFIMDVQYQLFCKTIRPLNCGHDLKKLKTRWNDNYNLFNKSMFVMFNDSEKSEIVDMMDEFENYIMNDVTIAKIQFMNVVKNYDLEIQDIIATGMMCNILSQSANAIYKKVYAVGRITRNQENRYISGVTYNSFEFVNLFHSVVSEDTVSFNGIKPLEDAIQVLINKMVGWIREH